MNLLLTLQITRNKVIICITHNKFIASELYDYKLFQAYLRPLVKITYKH